LPVPLGGVDEPGLARRAVRACRMSAAAIVVLGAAAGFTSSLLPGPTNVAVVDAALVRGRAAHAIGLGGALGDAVYATLGVTDAGALLRQHPLLPALFDLVSGVLMIVIGLARIRAVDALVVRRVHS